MSGRPALVTQAEVARAIRAAKKEGASAIELRPNGSIFVHLVPTSPQVTDGPLEPEKEIIL